MIQAVVTVVVTLIAFKVVFYLVVSGLAMLVSVIEDWREDE